MIKKVKNIRLFLIIFHKNKKNFIIIQQGEGLVTLTIRNDNGDLEQDGPHRDPARLIFSILKPFSFKKLNGTERGGDRKFSKEFCFYFIFLYF